MRQALGATHGRVTRQLLTENAVLAVLGAGLGVALAVPALRYLARLMPLGLPDGTAPALDVRVLLFTAGSHHGDGARLRHRSPAFAAARVDLESAIRTGGGRGDDRSRPAAERAGRRRARRSPSCCWWRRGCCCAATPTCWRVDPGFSPRNLLVAETPLPPLKYADTEPAVRVLRRRAQSRHRAFPASRRPAFANFPPLVFKGGRAFIAAEGEPPPAAAERIANTWRSTASPARGISRRSGVPLVRGRDFDARDAQSSVPVAIVNRTMAERRWPDQDPIGRRIKFGPAMSQACG